MKKIIYTGLLTVALGSLSSCDKFLDVNSNPSNPVSVQAELLLAPIQAQFAEGIQWDARYVAAYVQNFHVNSAGSVWDLHGYVPNSDAGGQVWRNVYWKGGRNLLNLLADAEASQKYEYLGVGKIMQAWGWQMLTDLHGEIIYKQAFSQDPEKSTFDYDTQEYVYTEIQRLLTEGLADLEKADPAVGPVRLARGDKMFNGDLAKWKKFANGMLALNYNHYSNKSTYDPAKVMAYADKAMASNADNATILFAGNNTSDASFFSPLRGNMNSYGQSAYIVALMDGTTLNKVTDPRIGTMLQASTDGVYRGIRAGSGQSSALPAAQRTPNLWGYTLASPPPATATGKYVFTSTNTLFPIMTYSQVQFVKAEAAFKKGDMATAYTAFRNGITAHMDYTGVPAASRNAYLASAAVPQSADLLKLSDIMVQKYIAQWGWGFVEQWTDLRRYDYSADVFTGFTLPTTLSTTNEGKTVQRLRPRYNSEYIWNIKALEATGGFKLDFHTYPIWITEP